MRGEGGPGAGEGQPHRAWESQPGARPLEERGSPTPEQGGIYSQMPCGREPQGWSWGREGGAG